MRALSSAMVIITELRVGSLSCMRLFITVVILTGGCLSAVLALICIMDCRKGLDIIIRCRFGLKIARRTGPVQRWDLMYGSTIPLDTVFL